MQSCRSCPSFSIDQELIKERFGRATNQAMCLRFGYVLSVTHTETTPEETNKHNESIAVHAAMSCEYHGQPVPPFPSPPSSTPVEIRVLRPMDDAPDTSTDLQTCNSCQWAIRMEASASAVGITTGVCSAKGILITSPRENARGCTFSSPGEAIVDFPVRRLFPQYQRGFVVKDDRLVDALLDNGNVREDPLNYPSDRPVTDEDRAEHIIAWREVHDPEGHGESVFLPIFDPDSFTEAERLCIPKAGSNEHPELYVDYDGLLYQFAVDSFTLQEALCLVGDPGLGKTEFCRWVAYLMQVPFYRFSFTKATEVDDMIGKILFDQERGTFWHDGRVTKAYAAHAAVIDLDELNLGPEETREFIRPMIDNSSQLVLDSGTGTSVTRGKYTRLLVAINPAWDIRNLGTAELADAEMNRMSFAYVGYPNESVEARIIRERCALDGFDITQDKIDLVIAIGADIREAAKNGTYPGSWGLRQQIKVARKLRFYDVVRAYKMANLNYIDPADAEQILDLISTHTS